ncbi:MAG TPA: NADP-dependent oxidoreductase, partial [Candidatus Acidoferrales bacterium]|nr:NADP-dependent oxidoreductase [Candidatus Acidoferrales bacterium]
QPRPFPIVLSHEFSGIVESLGPNATGLKVGDAVYGLNDWFTNGAQAEYCVAPMTAVAPAPKSIDPAQRAVVPISALTAWQGLFDRIKLQRDERLLIHGGAGGVGIFAVQLARQHGAHVIATASGRNLDFIQSLGAHEVIDYRTSRFEEIAREVDAVFDGVGGDTLARSWSLLKKGGRLVTVATGSEKTADQRVRDAFMLVQANASQLAEISALIDSNELRVYVASVFPLARAKDAYLQAQQGGMRGKIALSVTD